MRPNITINKHSSIKITSDQIIYFDPFMIEEETHDADIIFITHDHYDHFSPEDIAKVAKHDTTYVAPESCKASLEQAGIKHGAMALMSAGMIGEVDGVGFEAVKAYNISTSFHTEDKGFLGYIVDVENKRIFVTGDTEMNVDNVGVICDILLVPIGGTYTFDAKDAAEFTNVLAPSIAIPTHYGAIVGSMEDAEVFEQNVNRSIGVIKLIK